MSDYSRFEVSEDQGVTVVRLLDKELSDLVVQDELYDQLMGLIKNQQPARLLVNFSVVEYCTTGIINSLLSAKKRMLANEGEFKLCALTQHVRDAFRALNLEGTVFEVYEAEADAIKAFGS